MATIPTGADTLIFSGLSSSDVTVADLSNTIIPAAYVQAVRECSVLVESEPMRARENDTLDTRYVLQNKYLADSEFASFAQTLTVDVLVVFDSPNFADTSGTTLTVASIDAFQGFVTLENAATQTVYASYRWCPVRMDGTATDQLFVQAVMYKACEMAWAAVIGSQIETWIEGTRLIQRNHFRDRYVEAIRRINARKMVKVKTRTSKLKGPFT